MTSANDQPPPGVLRVRFDCRFAGNGGETTAVYADLSQNDLTGVVAVLCGYRDRSHPAYAIIQVDAVPGPDDDAGTFVSYHEFRAFRVLRLVANPGGDEEVLYERRLPQPVMDDDDLFDAVNLPLTRTQLATVLDGEAVRVDIPAGRYDVGLTVIVRLKKET